MIPSAIMNGLWKGKNLELEFRILELRLDGFTFRLSKRHGDITEDRKAALELRFFSFIRAEYQKIDITDFQITLIEELPFAYHYEVQISGETRYKEKAGILSKEYLDYIRLYMEEEPSCLSEQLTGYPASQDENYPQSYRRLKKELAEQFSVSIGRTVQQGIVVENPWQCAAFLTKSFPEYLSFYFQEAGFTEIPSGIKEVKYVYLGNQLCDHLLPGIIELVRILKKCKEEEKIPVLQLPPIREGKRGETEDFLEETAEYLSKTEEMLEVVVNDWGMLSFLSEKKEFSITMGILLLKQKKDPRLCWKNGFSGDMTSHRSGWKNGYFLDYTKKEYRVSRYSTEISRFQEAMPDENITMYAPWYQMNTSPLCPLYAAIRQGDRGKQEEIQKCDYLCREWNFLYPKHLQMCGRYNTIWGYQTELVLEDEKKGADRVVWNF